MTFSPKGEKCQFLGGKFLQTKKSFSENKKRLDFKEISALIEEISANYLKLNCKKTCLDCAKKPDPSFNYGIKIQNKTIGVLLDSGSRSSWDLLFVIPQLWGTSNSTFINDKVGDIEISFVEYSTSKKVHLQLDIVKYSPGHQALMYDLIIDMQTLHGLEVVLDFKEKTIQIDKIHLPMRNIANLQLKPSIIMALRHNTCLAQESISTRSATKCMMEIVDAKYEKADLPAIVKKNCSHLKASDREKLLSMLPKFELLFDGMLGDCNLPPVSFKLKGVMKPYHGRPYPILHKHKAVFMKEIKPLCT
jgi:hypothetical protein